MGEDAWYRTLVERLPAVVYVDASGEGNAATYVSPRAEDMLGYSQKEWLSDAGLWRRMLHTEDRERTLTEASRAREAGEPFEMEYRLVAKDGRVVWVRDEAAPMLDGEGRIAGWQGVMLDITERKEHEEGLRKSEERHRLVARATGEAIWDNDLTTGKQEWAGATEALFGYSPYKGRAAAWWEERIHPDDRERVLCGLQSLYEGDGEAWTEEYRFRRADGSYAIVVDRGYVVRDGSGKPVRMVGSMADVTERRRWEEMLKGSEERFRTTFEAAAVGIAHVAPDGRWLEVNGELCEILSYEREELLALTFWDLTPSGKQRDAHERVSQLLAGKMRSYSVERLYLRKDGSRIWADLSISLKRKASGEPDYFFCKIENITARKLEELVPDPLTDGEMKALLLISQGLTNRQIAEKLSYSEGTIKHRLQRIIVKLGVEDRKQAVARAEEIGLIPPY